MRRSSLVLVLMAMPAAGGEALYEAHAISHEREALAAEQKRVSRFQQQLVDLRQQRDEALRAFALATERLAAAAGAVVDPARASEVDSWLARVKRLSQSFDEHPDQRIPEFALLTDLDWLALARQLRLDSDEDLRKARATVRGAAIGKFQQRLGQALRDYAAAANGVPLSDLAALSPYFDPTIDPAILQRYEITGPINPGAPRDNRTITERTPVDGEFDVRHTVAVNGLGSGSSPWVFDSLRQASLDALSEFAAANNGQRPKREADSLPYVRDPTARALFEAMIAYENDHHGQQPNDQAALRPYVKDAAAQAVLEKLINTKQNSDAP